MKRITVEVMGSAEALKRAAKAWRETAKGRPVEPTIGLASMAQLTALLSPRRMELLKYVAGHPNLSIRALAQGLERDYKNVHTDVSDLEAHHLLIRDDGGKISAPFDEIVIRAPLKDAA